MPRGIYSNMVCKIQNPPFVATKHQEETIKYFLNSIFKGLLLYHKLGSGKTCTSLRIADAMLLSDKVKHVYILTPGSLRSGWVTEYCSVCGSSSELFKDKYTFVTTNYKLPQIPDFKDCLVIIDEVHNLINGVINQSKGPTKLYNHILRDNCRVLALSGTPITNTVKEFVYLGSLLKPGEDFPVKSIDDFNFGKYFSIKKDGSLVPKNPTVLKRLMDGIISYYPGSSSIEDIPVIEYMEPIRVKMTPQQEMNYWDRFTLETKLGITKPNKQIKIKDPKMYDRLEKLYIMSKKKILTRMASNFFYPQEYINIKDIPAKDGGWLEKSLFSDGQLYKIYSPKITALLTNIVAHDLQKHVLFTTFKQKAGVYLIKNILGMCGIKAEIFSGDLTDSERKSILKRFNSKKNRYGDDIKILLITEAGAEGISVLEARHIHILESSTRVNKIIQAIGRVARYKSHSNLPLEERKVKVWRYWSVADPRPVTVFTEYPDKDGKMVVDKTVITNKITVDEVLYQKGIEKLNEINSFLQILQSVSVT
jgi:superfamily II DNA or RNA helicase